MIGISVAVGEFLVGLLWAAASVGAGVGALALLGIGAIAWSARRMRRAWRHRS